MAFTPTQKQIIDADETIKHVRLEFPNGESANITKEKIYQEAMSLEESIVEGDTVQYGSCNASIFKIRVADFTDNIEGARMNVYIDFLNESLGNLLDVPFGKYIISQPPERTSDRRWRNITAVDYMTLFDVDITNFYNVTLFPTDSTTRTIKQCREMLYQYIGIQYEQVNLVNDSAIVNKTITPNTLSGRDFLQKLLEINGCFGHFDYEGIFRHPILYSNDSKIHDIQTFKNDCNYDDYNVAGFNEVVILNEDGAKKASFSNTQTNKVTYTVANNYILFNLSSDDTRTVARKMLTQIVNCPYRKNNVTVHGGIYIGLADKYTVHPSLYDGTQTITNTFKSYCFARTIQGIQALSSTFTANINNVSDESSRDITTEIESLRNKTNSVEKEVDYLGAKVDSYILYKNEQGYEMRTADVSETTIIEIPFRLDRKCYVVFHGTITFQVTTDSGLDSGTDLMVFNDGKVKFSYYVDDVKVADFEPEETYQDGKYTIHFQHTWYDENEDLTQIQTFKVKCRSTDCLLFIPVYDIHSYLTASGLYFMSDWDGRIDVIDDVEAIEISAISGETQDVVSASTYIPESPSISDNVSLFKFTGFNTMADNISTLTGMLFATTTNAGLLTSTATVSNNRFVNGYIITPDIYSIQSVSSICDNARFSVSFDGGTTWNGYVDGTGWVVNADMDEETLASIQQSAWLSPARIKATMTGSTAWLSTITVNGGYINV